jgi:hypothetical protein
VFEKASGYISGDEFLTEQLELNAICEKKKENVVRCALRCGTAFRKTRLDQQHGHITVFGD